MDMLVYDHPAVKADAEASAWFGKPAMLYYNGVLLCEDSIRCWFGYPLYKMWAHNYVDNVNRQDGGRASMYILRIAHAYLIRAEARFWQDKFAGAAEDHPGGHHAHGLCSFRPALHARGLVVELYVGRPVPHGRRLLHLPRAHRQIRFSAANCHAIRDGRAIVNPISRCAWFTLSP